MHSAHTRRKCFTCRRSLLSFSKVLGVLLIVQALLGLSTLKCDAPDLHRYIFAFKRKVHFK